MLVGTSVLLATRLHDPPNRNILTGKMAIKLIISAAAVLAVCRGAAIPAVPTGLSVPAIPATLAAPGLPVAAVDTTGYDPYPQYTYAYDVQDTLTGDAKSQHESREGDIVHGSYSLIEADGTRRIVEYTADPVNGFNAVVRREPLAIVKPVVAPPPLVYHQLFFLLGLAVLVRGAVVPAATTAAVAVPLAKLEEFDPAPQYSFAYDVQDAVTGDSKTQYETRNGDVVRGSYSLIEADGTRRIVEYTADPINGFNAIVSREPAIAAVAAATPVLPFGPAAALTPVAGLAPGAAAVPAAPSIPAVGPDSDVEVLDTRSGPLRAGPTTREQEIQRQQLQQLQQQEQQLQQLQDQQRRTSRLQIQQQQQQQQEQQLRQLQDQQRRTSRLQIQQQQQQQQEQRTAQQPARIIGQTAGRIASARLVGLPAAARAITTYPSTPYPYAAYSVTYSSPFAYAAPLNGLAYTPAVTST
ncbi:protein bassoon [Monomorium pharaonis]|uniref:protein bassoon n=1 Tax=Monomorium pharaonis TaxID=307658 RepID=UPI001747B308|nr:protein bassoon [Monomorium pharaonis]